MASNLFYVYSFILCTIFATVVKNIVFGFFHSLLQLLVWCMIHKTIIHLFFFDTCDIRVTKSKSGHLHFSFFCVGKNYFDMKLFVFFSPQQRT